MARRLSLAAGVISVVPEATGSAIAQEAQQRIAELYVTEAEISGQRPATRLAVRKECALPILAALHPWLEEQRRRLSA